MTDRRVAGGGVPQYAEGTAEAARHHEIRNADPELAGIHLEQTDEAKLVAFLRAMNEYYE